MRCEHGVVDVEVAGIDVAVGQDQPSRIRQNFRLVAQAHIHPRNHLHRRRGDGGARPQAVDADAVLFELAGMAQRAQAHAVFGHAVGGVVLKPVRLHRQGRRHGEHLRVAPGGG